MKFQSASTLTVAASFLCFAIGASAQSMNMGNGNVSSPNHPTGRREAAKMVPASVVLMEGMDARKLHDGDTFKARLAHKIRLSDGTELPSGTIFEGTVANDDMNVQGNSKLALRFTAADLKSGQTIPIKATIVSIYTPQNEDSYADSYDVDYPSPVPNSWNDGTLAVDQLNVVRGVDLHSRISSQNSGVLVTKTRDDFRIGRGTDLSLAVAESGNRPSSANAPSGINGGQGQ